MNRFDALREFDRRDEAVTGPRQRFNIEGVLGRVAQLQPQTIDCGVQPCLEIDKRAILPKALLQILPANESPGFL
jgi:hypothetical protein